MNKLFYLVLRFCMTNMLQRSHYKQSYMYIYICTIFALVFRKAEDLLLLRYTINLVRVELNLPPS